MKRANGTPSRPYIHILVGPIVKQVRLQHRDLAAPHRPALRLRQCVPPCAFPPLFPSPLPPSLLSSHMHAYAPLHQQNSRNAPVVGGLVGPAQEAVPVRARGARLLPRRLRDQHRRRGHRRQVLWHVPRRRGRVRRLPRRRCVVRPPSLPLASFLSLLPCLFLPFFLFLFLFDTRARARGTEPDGAHTG